MSSSRPSQPHFIPPMPLGTPPPPPPPPPQTLPLVDMRATSIDLDGRPAWANLELFRGMSLEALGKLREAMEPVLYTAGQIILRQGEDGDDMYLLDAGAVQVTVRGAMHDTNFERTLTAPALFGEMSLVTRVPRTATVTAEGEVRCLRVTSAGFDDLVRRNPAVSMFLTRAVGERLLEAESIQHVGKYKVVGRLGAGAVATVFEAMHPGLQRPVALKMLSHALVYHPKFAQQFQQEAQLVAQLNHDHIVRVFDTEAAYGTHFIVMEKLTGLTLDELIRTGTRLAWGAVRRILREIALALDYSHARGLMHRDIKPSNVFLTEEDRRVKLLDFGIAVSASSSAQGGGNLLGTPYYMSPEQIQGQRLDGRSDLYALGILAYELVTHEVPFDADNIQELLQKHLYEVTPDPRLKVPDVPHDLAEFILRATAKRPPDRFDSCAEAVTFLQLASELPAVHRIELTTLAISYHPSRRLLVADALAELNRRLEGTPGIVLLGAHQNIDDQAKDHA